MSGKQTAGIAGIACVAGVAEAIVLFCIPAFWHAGRNMGLVASTAILNAHWVSGFVAWIMALFLLVVLLIFGVALVVLGYLSIVLLLRRTVAALGDLAMGFDALSKKLSRDARDTAIDAGFVVVLGLASALVAYLSTEDFLAQMSLLRILAVAAMCCAALKAAMLIPVRSTQVLSGVLLAGIVVGTVVLLHHRHPLYPAAAPGSAVRWIVSARAPEIAAAVAIAVLSILSVLYPFTWKGWKRILSVS
jgi:hypothetical protein